MVTTKIAHRLHALVVGALLAIATVSPFAEAAPVSATVTIDGPGGSSASYRTMLVARGPTRLLTAFQ